MENSKTLYGLSKTGKPLQWTITWDTESNWFTLTTGQVDGKLTTTAPTFTKPKNIGKKNETTEIEQCYVEVLARIEKQRKKDFHDTIPENKKFNVTLAKEFNARKKFITFPMLASAKLDGFRCYITKDGMFSRTGKNVVSCPHIMESLENFFKINPTYVFDGELYSHELKDDFNTMASLLARTKNITSEFLEKTRKIVKFYIFDMFTSETKYSYYKDRSEASISSHEITNENLEFLQESIENEVYKPTIDFFNTPNLQIEEEQNISSVEDVESFISKELDDTEIELKESSLYIGLVKQFEVNSFEDVEIVMNHALSQGFEGIMLRTLDMEYEEGRSSNLIKYKHFKDSEYKVIEIQDGLGNHAGQAAVITCENDNGNTFNVGMGKGWNEEAKRALYANREQYIGKMATIIYQDLTPVENVPRFGKLKTFRDE